MATSGTPHTADGTPSPADGTPSQGSRGLRGWLLGSRSPRGEFDVDYTRAWTGLWVVVFGDVGIALAAIFGVIHVASKGGNGSLIVSILTSAFTAIGTMTTAYFGIRASSNTAEKSIKKLPGTGTGTGTGSGTGTGTG